jgi:hypothetical protein
LRDLASSFDGANSVQFFAVKRVFSVPKTDNLVLKGLHPKLWQRYDCARSAARAITRSSSMANTTDSRSHNQPSHEAQVKGGEHSHQGSSTSSGNQTSGREHNQPSHEAQVKGGQHSHQGGSSTSSNKENDRGHNQPSHEAQVKGGQHSYSEQQ